MKAIKLASNTQLAYSDLPVVLPSLPSNEALEKMLNDIKKPLVLMTPTKKTESFEVLQDVISSADLDTSGDVPVLRFSFSEQGWDRLAYLFLTAMAQQVKKNPKSVPRSYRTYANLMNKLTEHPTGNGKVDESRKVVIDRAIEQLALGVRNEITRRAQTWPHTPEIVHIS